MKSPHFLPAWDFIQELIHSESTESFTSLEASNYDLDSDSQISSKNSSGIEGGAVKVDTHLNC